MSSIRNLITVGAFSLLMLGIPAIASAQYGQYDPYSRNGVYNTGNRGYGDMRSVVRDLKSRTKQFERQLDRDLDRSGLDGTRREDQIMDLARDFRSAVNRLSNSGNYGRRDNNIERALQLGSQLERSIGRRRNLSPNARSLWSGIRANLQMLGNGYGYNNRGNRGNRTGGGWGNGTTPSWWPF